jgi:hypothetical protein
MEELRQRIRLEQMKSMSNVIDQLQQQQQQLPLKNLDPQPTQQREAFDTLYIVTFPKQQSCMNDDESNNENIPHHETTTTTTTTSLFEGGGVHSIEYPIGSGKNVVLAFTNQLSCDKFVQSLREQHFFHPMVRNTIESNIYIYFSFIPCTLMIYELFIIFLVLK